MNDVLPTIPFPSILPTGLRLGMGTYVRTKLASVEERRVILGSERLEREERRGIVVHWLRFGC